MREIPITKAQEGQRLDRFLGKCLPLASGGFLHKMLRKKNIKLNGQKAEGNEKLKQGDAIQIFFSDETFYKFTNNVDLSV
ncbi:MAG: RluA family pseudouridine synthase, partial [Eubacteriales bacterium]|nr:RluA family pseudouridine synthase [Eubacteriales bacterium]